LPSTLSRRAFAAPVALLLCSSRSRSLEHDWGKTDTDGDGIPDTWETEIFNSNPNVADANATTSMGGG